LLLKVQRLTNFNCPDYKHSEESNNKNISDTKDTSNIREIKIPSTTECPAVNEHPKLVTINFPAPQNKMAKEINYLWGLHSNEQIISKYEALKQTPIFYYI